jgi:hypothetical protein
MEQKIEKGKHTFLLLSRGGSNLLRTQARGEYTVM